MNRSVAKRKIFIDALRNNPALLAGGALLKQYALTNFEIVDSIEKAEIVLYLENGYVGLADLPRLLDHLRSAPSAMHFLFSESDWPFPVLPGAYPSLSKPCPWAQSWSFLPRSSIERTDFATSAQDAGPEFLFSFLGRISTHPVRKKVRLLDKANTPCLDVEDGPRRFPSFQYSQSYVQLLRRSRFVLCPRGIGASSIRIFEAMDCGRVPVIISDQWQPSPEIRWADFCVFVPEGDVLSIPALLDRLDSNAHEMGRLAREAFVEHFAPNVFLDRLLMTLVSKYSDCSFAPAATCERAWRALGWREIRTLGHQGRSLALSYLSPR